MPSKSRRGSRSELQGQSCRALPGGRSGQKVPQAAASRCNNRAHGTPRSIRLPRKALKELSEQAIEELATWVTEDSADLSAVVH
jgi:hypothetical protein